MFKEKIDTFLWIAKHRILNSVNALYRKIRILPFIIQYRTRAYAKNSFAYVMSGTKSPFVMTYNAWQSVGDKPLWISVILWAVMTFTAIFFKEVARYLLPLVAAFPMINEIKRKYEKEFLPWYHKTWPGNDKVVLVRRLWPYSDYVTIYDKMMWVALMGECWGGRYYTAYTRRFQKSGLFFPHLRRDYLKTKRLMQNASSHYQRLKDFYEVRS